MKFIVSYITKTEIKWAGFETVIADSVFEKEPDFPESLKGKIRLLESGLIKRENKLPPDASSESEDDNNSPSESDVNDKVVPDITLEESPQYTYDTGMGFLSADLTSDMEIELPFSDKKKALKVIPLQIQDRLPYDLTDCHTTLYQSAGSTASLYKYFYSAIDKNELSDIIGLCGSRSVKLCSLHPEIYAGAGIFHLSTPGTDSEYKIFIIEKNDSVIFSAAKGNNLFNARNIRVSEDRNISRNQLNAQLGISMEFLLDGSEKDSAIRRDNKIILFHIPGVSSHISGDLSKSDFPLLHVSLKTDDIILHEGSMIDPSLSNMAVCTYLGLMLKDASTPVSDYQLSKKIYPDLRSGEFRYRAPLTEIKNSLVNELVPFTLLIFFGLLTLLLIILTPLKQDHLNRNKIHAIAKEALEDPFITPGRELVELEERVYALENELGDLSTLQSLSPIEWLHLVSDLIPASIPLEIDSLSITTKGISFRGTIPDYPTSGKISSLLDSLKVKHPERFCEVDLKTEDVAIGVASKQIRAEVSLCE